jgi:arabinogalactan endo-1,4-beta-galactosidase
MNFDKEPRYKSEENLVINNQTLIESRKLIEKYISENTKIHIKTSEVFFDYHYSDICDCSKKFDPNHYTKLGYQLITSKIEEVIKSL